jgi:hypothetical protein
VVVGRRHGYPTGILIMPSALIAALAPDQNWQYFDLEAHNARQRKLRDALASQLQSALAREAALRQENAVLLKRQRERAAEIEHRLFEMTHRLQGLCDDLGPLLFDDEVAHAVPIGPMVAEILTSAAGAIHQAQALANGCRDGIFGTGEDGFGLVERAL